MRTEDDLRALFTAREDLAPDQHLVLEGARRAVARHRRRRTVAAVAAAAAVVVALPVTARALWAGESQPPPAGTQAASSSPMPTAPSGSRPPFAFTIRPGSAAGSEITPLAVNADVQIATISGAGGEARLIVYRSGVEARVHPGGWDAGEDAVRVAVNGAPAWYSTRDKESTLRWEHAPGGWAVLSSTSSPAVPRETLVALAEAVRFTAPYPAKVPYRLGYLPAGYKPFHFSQGDSRWVVQLTRDRAQGDAMDISVARGPASALAGWRADRTMAGHPADCTELVDGRRCVVDFGTFTVDIGSGGMPDDQVTRIVANMSFADLDDPATWSDLDAALPGR